jgi:hypothetical protein
VAGRLHNSGKKEQISEYFGVYYEHLLLLSIWSDVKVDFHDPASLETKDLHPPAGLAIGFRPPLLDGWTGPRSRAGISRRGPGRKEWKEIERSKMMVWSSACA